MSSHHFVKEGQEPALLLLDVDFISFEKVQELLEWSPLVMVSYDALKKVLSWEIKIDVLLTPSTSADVRRVAIDQAPLHIIDSSENKNVLAEACLFLQSRKQNHVNVIAREASAYFADATSLSNKMKIVLFEGDVRWHLVENSYSKWHMAQTTIRIFEQNTLTKIIAPETGILKIKRSTSFWVGEEY